MIGFERPLHFVRFGSHAEQPFVSGDLQGLYQGLVFNANLIAWSAAGVAGFLCKNNLVTKPFFIDPLTHAFQHDPTALRNKDDQLKVSVSRLVNSYGAPFEESVAAGDVILPDDFGDAEMMRDFTQRVLDFQRRTLDIEAQATDAWPYLKFAFPDLDTLAPCLLIAPYFYMTTGTYEDWLPLNLRFAEEAVASQGNEVAVQVCVGQDVLEHEQFRNTIVESYGALDSSVILLWIDDYSEHESSSSKLNGFRHLVSSLARRGKNVVNLYGGFMSTVMTHPELAALSAVCHGPQYGESRGVIPVGGGIPTARFYFPDAHHRFRFADAVRILIRKGWLESAETYHENVCRCPVCVKLFGEMLPDEAFSQYGETRPVTFERGGTTVTMEYPVREALTLATQHYMYRKSAEFDYVLQQGASIESIAGDLRRAYNDLAPILGLDAAIYLKRWASFLSQA